MFILSQIFVIFALIAFVFSMLSKQKENILYYRIPFIVLYAISFALQGLWVAFATILFSVVSTIVFYRFERKGEKPNFCILMMFLFILLLINYLSWGGILDLLPTGTSLLLMWTFWQNNAKVLRIMVLIASTSMIIYNILVLNYMGIIVEFFIQILQIIAFVRYDILKKESLIKNPHKK